MAPTSRRVTTSRVSGDEVLATLRELQHQLPKLFVFDLDNTMWTPELYELYEKPQTNVDIHLFPDVTTILEILSQIRPRCAIASRAEQDDWANDLLDEFRIHNAPLRDLFPEPSLIHIVGRSKIWHFERIREESSIDFSDMIFYDDSVFNIREVSSLGVFCCHTPRGLTLDLFHTSLRDFVKMKQQQQQHDKESS